jgi:hypothetical protein
MEGHFISLNRETMQLTGERVCNFIHLDSKKYSGMGTELNIIIGEKLEANIIGPILMYSKVCIVKENENRVFLQWITKENILQFVEEDSLL